MEGERGREGEREERVGEKERGRKEREETSIQLYNIVHLEI